MKLINTVNSNDRRVLFALSKGALSDSGVAYTLTVDEPNKRCAPGGVYSTARNGGIFDAQTAWVVQ